MPRECTMKMLLLMWIYLLAIPITMTLASNMNSIKLDDHDVIIRAAKSASSGPSKQNNYEIFCPEYCACYRTSNVSFITASCEKLMNETYFEENIKHFVLENGDNITLGPLTFLGRNLLYLKSITIKNNGATKISPGAFYGLEYLNSVVIDNNEELDIHPDVFQNNSQLNFLTINHFKNFASNCNTTKDYLFDAPSLTELSLSVINYECWSPSTFTRMPKIKSLSLTTPNLKILPGIFAPLRKLVKLKMCHINHLNITKETFDGIKYLQNLTLAYSTVTSLSNIRAPRLKYLRMKWITMKDIGKDDFIGMPTLEKLELINGSLETIYEDAFSNLTRLKYLDISGNNIDSLTENHLGNNFQLETLIMSYNYNLKRLPVFESIYIDSYNYSIKVFACHDCGLESIADGTFDAMPALTRLCLNDNRLQSLPRGLFKSLSSLESLDLSNNLISDIPNDMFEGAIKLTNLKLSKNPITALLMTPFLQTPELSTLDLSMCQIKIWNAGSPPHNSLRFLSLHNNELDRITVDDLRTMPNLSRMEALFNPIKCDNVLNDTIRWLISHRVMTTFDVPSRQPYCNGRIKDKYCWDFVHKYICDPNYILESERMKQGNSNGQDLSNTYKQEHIEGYNHTRHYLFEMITSSFIPCIVIILTAITAVTVIKFRPYKRILKERNINLTNDDLVHKPLKEDFTSTEIPKWVNNCSTDIHDTPDIVNTLWKKI